MRPTGMRMAMVMVMVILVVASVAQRRGLGQHTRGMAQVRAFFVYFLILAVLASVLLCALFRGARHPARFPPCTLFENVLRDARYTCADTELQSKAPLEMVYCALFLLRRHPV